MLNVEELAEKLKVVETERDELRADLEWCAEQCHQIDPINPPGFPEIPNPGGIPTVSAPYEASDYRFAEIRVSHAMTIHGAIDLLRDWEEREPGSGELPIPIPHRDYLLSRDASMKRFLKERGAFRAKVGEVKRC